MKNASILISCEDRPGIVHAVTEFLLKHGTNIANLEQHIEDGVFFMRIEWQVLNSDLANSEIFLQKFQPIAENFKMDLKVDFQDQKKRLALFCSRELHCLIDLLGRIEIKEIDVEVSCIVSNFREAEDVAEKFKVPFHLTASSGDWEGKQLKLIERYKPDLIALARYMKILSADFVEAIGSDRIINVHHSFLPSFIGANPYEEAHGRGVKLIGATAHYIIPELDQGPIIEQGVTRVSHAYDVNALKIIGRELEKKVFSTAIKKHLENKLLIFKNRVIVFT